MRQLCAALLLCLTGCDASGDPDGNIYLACDGFFGLEPTNVSEFPQLIKLKVWIDTSNRRLSIWDEEKEGFVDSCAGVEKCTVNVDSHNIRAASFVKGDDPDTPFLSLDFDRVSGHAQFKVLADQEGSKARRTRSADLTCFKIGLEQVGRKAF